MIVLAPILLSPVLSQTSQNGKIWHKLFIQKYTDTVKKVVQNKVDIASRKNYKKEGTGISRKTQQ